MAVFLVYMGLLALCGGVMIWASAIVVGAIIFAFPVWVLVGAVSSPRKSAKKGRKNLTFCSVLDGGECFVLCLPVMESENGFLAVGK